MEFNYKMIRSRSMGYAMFHRAGGFWQQCTKWYCYVGTLKRFNPCAHEPCLYQIID